jgi:hypothetical protein
MFPLHCSLLLPPIAIREVDGARALKPYLYIYDEWDVQDVFRLVDNWE